MHRSSQPSEAGGESWLDAVSFMSGTESGVDLLVVVVVEHLLRLLGGLYVVGLAPGVMLDAVWRSRLGAWLLWRLCMLRAARFLMRQGAPGIGCC